MMDLYLIFIEKFLKKFKYEVPLNREFYGTSTRLEFYFYILSGIKVFLIKIKLNARYRYIIL